MYQQSRHFVWLFIPSCVNNGTCDFLKPSQRPWVQQIEHRGYTKVYTKYKRGTRWSRKLSVARFSYRLCKHRWEHWKLTQAQDLQWQDLVAYWVTNLNVTYVAMEDKSSYENQANRRQEDDWGHYTNRFEHLHFCQVTTNWKIGRKMSVQALVAQRTVVVYNIISFCCVRY